MYVLVTVLNGYSFLCVVDRVAVAGVPDIIAEKQDQRPTAIYAPRLWYICCGVPRLIFTPMDSPTTERHCSNSAVIGDDT